ncbi:MAG: HEAT repeat domain-containing protein [Planctomycetes bacterium]|nr:HEAT repeat domain-containing protein [Planctomycetota bacterium]
MRRTPTSRAFVLSLLALAACQAATGTYRSTVALRHAPREEAVDAEHYALDLVLLPETRELRGTCTLDFVAVAPGVDALELDLEALEVSAVRGAGGAPLEFVQRPGRLRVELGRALEVGEAATVSVDYGGRPVKGLWFVEDGQGGVRQVFTQGECLDSRGWFPCLDYPADRATSELRVELPADWIAVAAGERIDAGETPGGRFERWRMTTPHPAYLTTLCAGDFASVTGEWDGVPLAMYADPRFAAWLPSSFDETDDVLACFSELTGRRYPYAKYAQTCVGNFPFGGMENISATTLTELTLGDELSLRDGGSTSLVAHEAAHQWFGDLLTCRDWSHVWLNEGFATYLTLLYFERTRGVDEFRARMRDTQRSYTRADVGLARRPTVYDVYRAPFDLFFGGHAYPGGASRLHYLRFVLGDEAFFAGVRRYVADHESSAVTTDDLQAAMEAASGRDLAGFFDQWFHHAGYPELEVDWSWDAGRKLVLLEVAQVQAPDHGTPSVFQLEVDVELRVGAQRTLERLVLDERKESFEFPAAVEPVWVRFDKHGALPARVASKKAAREWVALAAEDDDVNGRRDAADALGLLLAREEDPTLRQQVLSALVSRLRDDPHAAVRRAAAESLGRAPAEATTAFLRKAALEDAEASVRVAALDALTGYGASADRAALALEAWEAGYSWNAKIAAAGLYTAAAPREARAWLLDAMSVPSPHGKLQAGLVNKLAGLADEGVVADLVRLAGDASLPAQAREAAANGLGKRARFDRTAREVLLALLDAPDYRLRQAAIENLGKLGDQGALPRLRAELAKSVHSREQRKLEEALEALER